MSIFRVMLLMSSAALVMPLSGHADDDFYGVIESIPEGKTGTWVVGGRQVAVNERTRLEEDHGPLTVGTCVEVEYDGNVVEEIESERMDKCRKRAATLP